MYRFTESSNSLLYRDSLSYESDDSERSSGNRSLGSVKLKRCLSCGRLHRFGKGAYERGIAFYPSISHISLEISMQPTCHLAIASFLQSRSLSQVIWLGQIAPAGQPASVRHQRGLIDVRQGLLSKTARPSPHRCIAVRFWSRSGAG